MELLLYVPALLSLRDYFHDCSSVYYNGDNVCPLLRYFQPQVLRISMCVGDV